MDLKLVPLEKTHWNKRGKGNQVQPRYNIGSSVVDAVFKQKRWKHLTDLYYDQEESLSRPSCSPSPELYPDGTRKGKSKAYN